MNSAFKTKNLEHFLRTRLDGDAVRSDLISILRLVACSQLGLIISAQQEPENKNSDYGEGLKILLLKVLLEDGLLSKVKLLVVL